jgi:threonylcarbamoyladenosine tRNA methylthiotransferase CDKAL1
MVGADKIGFLNAEHEEILTSLQMDSQVEGRIENKSVQSKKRDEDPKKGRIFIEGHGCSASYADTEIISGTIAKSGFEIVEEESEADLSILVTCSVKSVTEQRMLTRIRELREKGQKVLVAGCLSAAEPKKILSIDNSLSLIGPGNLDKVVQAVSSTLNGEQFISTEMTRLVKLGMPRTRQNQAIGIVEISSGCLSSCTFCQVKLVKGTVFSYPEDKIVEEARLLISQGVREVWLTSTDNSAYGRDTKTSLSKLIRKICAIEADFKIRLGMMNPLLTRGRVLDDLISSIQDGKVFKFLHLPVQSGSNRILKLMQRGYTVDDYFSTIEEFRRAIPNLTLSTDVIVGFPTETEADFEETVDMIQRSKPDVLNLSRFGARGGTKAATMENQVPASVSKIRSERLSKVWKQIALERNQRWLGWQGIALIDEAVKEAYIARNDAYKPCLIEKKSLIEKNPIGTKLRVRVREVTPFTLHSTPLQCATEQNSS